MAVEDIQKYLREYGSFPREILVEKLRAAGYPEAEIQAAIQGSQSAPASPATAGSRDYSVAAKVGLWIAGFVLGAVITVGVTWAFLFVNLGFLRYLGYGIQSFLVAPATGVIAALLAFFLRTRSRFLTYGVLTGLITAALAVVGFIVFLWFIFRGGFW